MGFVLRLVARLPFLFIAGRIYGAEALGRFAYAVLIVEFAAQLATLGLKRGLAQQLANTDRDHAHVVWDALLVAAIGSAAAMALLASVPQIMFPNSEVTGLEWVLPITVIALAWSDISLAALAYRNNVGATVRARADRRAVDDHHRRLRLVVHLDQGRADHRLCAVDDRRAGRVDDPVPQELWPAARLEPAPGGAVADGAAQPARRRRRRGRMGLAPHRHRRARAVLLAGDRRHLLCRAAGRLAAVEAQDQLRPDPRPGDQPQPRRRRQGRGRAAGAPGRLLGDRRAGRRWRSRSAFRARR